MTSAQPPFAFNVLLAEDDADLRAMLAIVLRNDGHKVTEFSNGGDLELYLQNVLLDGPHGQGRLIVVADVRMPERNGLTTMKLLEHRGCQVPFILMTGFGDPRTHAVAEQLGALAVFDKPFDFDELRRTIRTFGAAARV